MVVGLIVPVMKNFKGLTELMHSVDMPVLPLIQDNWTENHGVSKAWNAGIRQAIEQGCEAVVIANDDLTLAPGTLGKLVVSLDEADLISGVNHEDAQSGVYLSDFPDYACFAIEPEKFTDKFGWFDENFSPAYFEDNDMAYRIKVANGMQGLRLDASIHHKGSVTQNMDGGVVSSEMFERNRAYFVSKWGGWPRDEQWVYPYNDENLTYKDWR